MNSTQKQLYETRLINIIEHMACNLSNCTQNDTVFQDLENVFDKVTPSQEWILHNKKHHFTEDR